MLSAARVEQIFNDLTIIERLKIAQTPTPQRVRATQLVLMGIAPDSARQIADRCVEYARNEVA